MSLRAAHFPSASTERGFSLIEVLVSFVLLSMALTVILQIFSTNLRNVDAARKQTHAMVIAESKFAALGTEIPIEPGETTGESGDFSWQLSISPYTPAENSDSEEQITSDDYQLYDIAVAVSWARGAETPELKLRTLRIGAVE
ncbi:MAG: prepilin-type N-terminal cleavage/methylation domain-containing protein [Gammaproteobacteria bacterium]|nr:prepilin-type N-terminal cleavage/methylation domain-containing protein [Gammaproteobacteria bacterium]